MKLTLLHGAVLTARLPPKALIRNPVLLSLHAISLGLIAFYPWRTRAPPSRGFAQEKGGVEDVEHVVRDDDHGAV